MKAERVDTDTMGRRQIIKVFYESNMTDSQPDYKVLGWESEEAQSLRFDIFYKNVDIHDKKLLDVGCGLGNLLEYLNRKGTRVDYTGVDILESMIYKARNKKLNGKFYCMDLFKSDFFEKESFDIVFTSGIFNLNLSNNREFFSKALKKFFYLSREIVAFNLLHRDSKDREEEYYYFEPEEVVELIHKNAGNDIEIKIVGQYLHNDFTVICTKK